jgi:hypothetical protein
MSESAFLGAVGAFLTSQAGLSPAPAGIGTAEPDDAAGMPAVILSLEQLKRPGNGIGERSALITDGALPWSATIDLANPVHPEEPGFNLLSADRRTLTLLHGGLVQAEGGDGPLGPDDLTVTVAGTPQTVVTGAPAAGQVRAEPLVGRLIFGTPLPAAGNVAAGYFLGQWEQRTTRLAGTLRVDVRDPATAAVGTISDGIATALQGPLAPVHIRRLHRMALTDMSSVGTADPLRANSRVRSLRFAFDIEQEVNRPESSGGIIQRIPVTTRLQSSTADPASGVITTTTVEETD